MEHYAFERYAYTVMYLPAKLAASLPFERGRLRIAGEVADLPVDGAWQPAGSGRHYFILSRKFLRDAGLRVGDVAEMRFRIADPEKVVAPPALIRALKADKAAFKVWTTLTPGAQRAFCHRVASAKTPETIARRVNEVVAMVRRGEGPGKPRATSPTGPARRRRAAET
ncbi:MAG: YdeI/OmpD-associated family protein [Hyphomonadaceae bacterium]|nr:YdeI/OmpD-associated family protein [Hyphomonadaceae bacterium]